MANYMYVSRERIMPKRQTVWNGPIDYRRGTTQIRVEVIEKPPGNEPTLCAVSYYLNKPWSPDEYTTLYSAPYEKAGIYEKEVGHLPFDDIAWSKGLKEVRVAITNPFTHNVRRSANAEKFFPTKVRVTVVHVSAGSKYDPSMVPIRERTPVQKNRRLDEGRER